MVKFIVWFGLGTKSEFYNTVEEVKACTDRNPEAVTEEIFVDNKYIGEVDYSFTEWLKRN